MNKYLVTIAILVMLLAASYFYLTRNQIKSLDGLSEEYDQILKETSE